MTEPVASIERKSAASWEKYWRSGAAVDLSGSKDPRWLELERRIVLSQYLMRANESGLFPPQESGLVNNGWFGRFHFEMIWWHGVHYGLWNRMECFDNYLNVYKDFMPKALERAKSVRTSALFLHSDFKKENGYLRSVELAETYSLYRQNYCGCVFSDWRK